MNFLPTDGLLEDHAWVAYNTSKSAVLQMARSMACELGKHKIRVNSISPGSYILLTRLS
jgi:NAD(P)-dependent dehydrogenase (short-subunit alcohol dehydrogenase family)